MPQPGQSRHATLDVLTRFEDGAAARTSTDVGEVDGVDKVIDFANGASLGDVVPETQFDWHVIVSACDDANADETYVLTVELSTDSAFTSPVVRDTLTITRGDTGRWDRPLSNVLKGTAYRYARVKHTLGGTSPSITYDSYAAKP